MAGGDLLPAEYIDAPSTRVHNHIKLQHLCFSACPGKDVCRLHNRLTSIATIIAYPPQEDGFVPGYYSMLFEGPKGFA
jgi:hypothetical protein